MSSEPERLTFITANIKGFPAMRPKLVLHDYKLVLDQRPDIVFWQEGWLWYYRKVLSNIIGSARESYFPDGIAGTGITWDREKFHARWTFDHFIHGVVPSVCAERRIRGAVLRPLDGGSDIMAGSVHLAPWRDGKGRKAQEAGLARLKTFIRHHVRMGRRVVIGIDANMHQDRLKSLLGDELGGQPVRYVSHTVDHLILVGFDIKGSNHFREGTVNSDHLPLKAEVE